MVDPSIALSYKPAQMDSPVDVYSKIAGLKSLANQQQIQQAQLQAYSQENAQRDLQMRSAAALNQAIQANTKQNPDGTISINHDAVAKAMANAGFGAAGNEYAENQKKTDLTLANLTAEQREKALGLQKQALSMISTVKSYPPGPQRDAAYQQARQTALKFGADPNAIPQTTPDDATLSTWELLTTEGISRMNARTAEQREKDYQDYVKVQDKKADAYTDWMMTRKTGDEPNYKYVGMRNGRAVYADQNGNEKVGGPIDQAPTASGRGGAGVTPTQQDRDAQAALKTVADAEKQEGVWDRTRQALNNAVQSGDMFIDQKGNPVSWQKLIPRGKDEADDDYAARIEKLKPSYLADMKARYQAATNAANQATANKNNAMNRYADITGNNGARPQVSTDQASAARGGKAPATGQPQGALPNGGGKTLDKATAAQFLAAAGGDKAKARALASQNNWKF